VHSTPCIGDLIDLHMADMADVGKAAQRSKEYTLARLKETLGNLIALGAPRRRLNAVTGKAILRVPLR
jgi:hypothetical protein